MFQDEATFGRIAAPRRCWAPRPVRPRIARQPVREFTYVYAAVSPADGVLDSLLLPDMDGGCLEVFLDEVRRRHADEEILMVLDGAGSHQAHGLRVPDNMRLLRQPPHSPELNPAEHLWEEIREKWFGNRYFADMATVEAVLVDALRTLENERQRVRSLTGFAWIVNIILNAK